MLKVSVEGVRRELSPKLAQVVWVLCQIQLLLPAVFCNCWGLVFGVGIKSLALITGLQMSLPQGSSGSWWGTEVTSHGALQDAAQVTLGKLLAMSTSCVKAVKSFCKFLKTSTTANATVTHICLPQFSSDDQGKFFQRRITQ